MNKKKVVFYVGISLVSIKLTEHYMAAWGYEFHLLVLKVSLTRRFALVRDAFKMLSALEDKICVPARPFNILYFNSRTYPTSGSASMVIDELAPSFLS